MAIQAQMYPENLGLPLGGGSQDLLLMDSNNNININSNNCNNFFLNGCGFNEFNYNLLQQKQQQQQQYLVQQQRKLQLVQQQQQQQQEQQFLSHLQNGTHSLSSGNGFTFLASSENVNKPSSTASTISTTTSSDHHHQHMSANNLSQSLAQQLEKQRQETDRYISLQNDRFKVGLQEQRKRHMGEILRKLEEKATFMLRQKDEEIAKVTRRTLELEDFVKRMEVENQAWQRVASDNEALVVNLTNTLEQLKEQACCLTSSNGVDDAESCCDVDEFPCSNNNTINNVGNYISRVNEGETGECSSNNNIMMGVCRVCKSGKSCVLLLPCRHLCSCKACVGFLDACPVCKSPKKASIEALYS